MLSNKITKNPRQPGAFRSKMATFVMMETWTIEVERMRVYAYHGVDLQEQKVGNDFEVSLAVEVDAGHAAATDDVAHTVSYADLAAIIAREMAVASQLLEHVAMRIRRAVAESFPEVTGGRVSVSKIVPPIAARMARATVSLRW